MTNLTTDDVLIRRYIQHFAIRGDQGRDSRNEQQLRDIVGHFAKLPYENLSKIIAFQQSSSLVEARRTPIEVFEGYVHHGTGGTCFSLTATLLDLVRSIGIRAEPILADRPYGENTHCAILVWLGNTPHLVDPGFLMVDPIPIPRRESVEYQTSFNQLRLVPRDGGNLVDLYSIEPRRDTLRLTFKTTPVDWETFCRVWDDSFRWDMMKYPVVTQVIGGQQKYLRATFFQTRQANQVDRLELSVPQISQQLVTEFGIDQRVVAEALSIWRGKGELG